MNQAIATARISRPLRRMALFILAGPLVAAHAQALTEMPQGYALAELQGAEAELAPTDQARASLILAAVQGGKQGGVAEAPSSLLYVLLSAFAGGAAPPRDLTLPNDSVK